MSRARYLHWLDLHGYRHGHGHGQDSRVVGGRGLGGPGAGGAGGVADAALVRENCGAPSTSGGSGSTIQPQNVQNSRMTLSVSRASASLPKMPTQAFSSFDHWHGVA